MTRRGETGFSLIELVAVLAIFALMATMGLQALSGTMRAQDRLAAAGSEAAELARALALLRQDLESVAPLDFVTPAGPAEDPFVSDPEAGLLRLSTAGRPRLPGSAEAGLVRVVWRYDPNARRLDRMVWRSLIPAEGAALSAPEPVLDDVIGFEVGVYDPQDGWFIPGRDTPLNTSGGLPGAVEVRVTHARFGPLLVMVQF